MSMFCYQCEQTAQGTGCQVQGVCGKLPDVAALQDVIVHQLKGISAMATTLRRAGNGRPEADRAVADGLFVTVTNVNFDPDDLVARIRALAQVSAGLHRACQAAQLPVDGAFIPGETLAALLEQARTVGFAPASGPAPENADLRSLRHLLIFGLKGAAAYAHHAALLGREDDAVYAFFQEALGGMDRADMTMEALVDLNMRCGLINVRCMELLNEAHVARFGAPEPTEVSTALRSGPAIIVTGHDLLDLETLLQQTEGKGVSVYTHGEMLPAHGYPGLKKYRHLAGHFGTAWQNQQREFDGVPAAVLFTTNCIQKPRESYRGHVFTCGLVAWPGTAHVTGRDFSPVIRKALELGGLVARPGGKLMTGFGHQAVLNVAPQVIEAVKAGKIRHFFLVGGCDGAKPGRNYYTEFVRQVPADCVVLTLACGKFRFNDMDLGTIGGLPRLMDVGQCNDAYSAVKIAQALAQAFGCGINELPLSLVLSWYEQKAVAILLSLLALGVKNIRLGPTLPAFVSSNVLGYLVKTFNIQPVTTPEQDLAAILKKA